MNQKLLFAIRVALSLVWLYNGLWLKVALCDPHHLEIVRSIFGTSGGVDPVVALRIIGSCETLLGLGILSGLFYRFVSIFQIVIIAAMNLTAIFASRSIAHPVGLIVSNLPTIMCAIAIAIHGPGWLALTLKRKNAAQAV